ncbi:MAG: hypothetical protein KF744_07855 [Taibaiella sp.]|nr:hypothetical protein [Taibaiella sp.]
MMRMLMVLLAACVSLGCAAQSRPVRVTYVLGGGNEQFVLPTRIGNKRIDLVRFYVSSVELMRGGKPVWKEPGSYHLVDFTDSGTLAYKMKTPEHIHFDRIRFHLGIDSATNVSGAMGGDLDPAKGMYWAWQSGYINFKIEGTSPDVPSAKHEFTFHLGGYAAPNATLQTVDIAVREGKDIVIGLDVATFLASIEMDKVYHIMSPCAEAVTLSAKAAKCFSAL